MKYNKVILRPKTLSTIFFNRQINLIATISVFPYSELYAAVSSCGKAASQVSLSSVEKSLQPTLQL